MKEKTVIFEIETSYPIKITEEDFIKLCKIGLEIQPERSLSYNNERNCYYLYARAL